MYKNEQTVNCFWQNLHPKTFLEELFCFCYSSYRNMINEKTLYSHLHMLSLSHMNNALD